MPDDTAPASARAARGMPRPPALRLEGFVTSLETARAAEAAGADRLELCGPGEGGVTPSPDLLAAVLAAVRVPVHVMIRPRAGDFTYVPDELAAMHEAIDRAKAAGAAGVVFGVLRANHALDVDAMRALVARARPLRVGCHRAFDRTPDPDAALEALLELGVDLVLTSGHASTALEGAAVLARHVRRAGDWITILAGGAVRAENVRAVVAATGVREVHARALEPEVFASLVQAVRGGT
jgi:copper homeostasis protein